MIYLHRYSTGDDGRPSIDIAVVEDERGVAPYEARGYTRCTPEAFRAMWRLRDRMTLARMRAALGTCEREVGNG